MKTTKKIWRVFLPIILILSMLPNVSLRVYANNDISYGTITLSHYPDSVTFPSGAVRTTFSFSVSAQKSESVQDITLWFYEGSLSNGEYSIPFKVGQTDRSEGYEVATFYIGSNSLQDALAVFVDSASWTSANSGVYYGYLPWTAKFWSYGGEKLQEIYGQIPVTLKVGYEINVSSNNYGTVSASCAMARAGETVTLTAVPNEGFLFKEWQVVSGNVTIENNQFIMPERDVEICAIFDKTYEVKFEANGGTGTMDSDTFFASEGSYTLPPCDFTAPDGYTFKDWTVTWENEGGASSSTTCVARSVLTGLTKDITVSANWMELSLKASPSGAGTAVYENGAFTATANAGYTFDHWEYADDEYSTAPIGTVWPTDNPYQPAEVNHKIYTAVFKANTYNLTLLSNNNERGTVTYSGTPKTGNTITLTATANEGYIFKEWQIEPTGIVIDANNKFKMPASNVTVTAVFDHLQTVAYSMTVNKGTGMTKTEDSGAASQTGLTGAMTTVVYTADDGYYFPTDYCVSSVNGISVTRNSYNQIIVSGTPTADTTITLLAATAKTTPNAPTTPVADNCTTSANNDGKITGVTTAMEYKKSDDSGWTAVTETEIMGLTPGTYYMRLKATDTTFASANKELTITAYTAPGQVAAPTFSPGGGTYTEAQSVTISCATSGTEIYYTTNGTTPTSNSTKYTGAISVTSTTTIKAIAIKSGMTNSAFVTATYTINNAPAPTTYTITFNPNGGTVSPTSKVTGNNGKLSSLPTPSRSGYSFNGWFTSASGSTKVTTSTVFTSNDTVYAHWEKTASNPSNNDNPAKNDNTSNNNSNNDSNSSSSESESNNTAPANSTIPLTPVIPIIPINNTDSKPVPNIIPSNQEPNIAPDITDIGKPFIEGNPDKDGWDVIKENIQDVIKENVSDPSTEGKVIVDMNGYSIVPGDIITEIKGQDVTVVLNLGDGIRWSINGLDVTGDNIGDIDFSVKVGTNKIPVDVINNVTGERYCIQISLSHEGDFGFTATLFVDMDKKNAGLYANLFYFNPSTEGLEFICADEIDENGVADLKFTHASDYTIAIDKEPMNNTVTVEQEEMVQENTEPQGAFLSGDDNSLLDDSNDSVDSKNRIRWWIISLMCLVLAGGFTVVWIIRKK